MLSWSLAPLLASLVFSLFCSPLLSLSLPLLLSLLPPPLYGPVYSAGHVQSVPFSLCSGLLQMPLAVCSLISSILNHTWSGHAIVFIQPAFLACLWGSYPEFIEAGRPTPLWVSPFLKLGPRQYKGRESQSQVSLLFSWQGCNVTSCSLSLLLRIPCHDGL